MIKAAEGGFSISVVPAKGFRIQIVIARNTRDTISESGFPLSRE
jgi:hypothetical protein